MFTSLAIAHDTAPVAHDTAPKLAVVTLPAVTLPAVNKAAQKAIQAAQGFNYAGLFKADTVTAAFNADVVRQAESGRVAQAFIDAMGFTYAMVVPAQKAQFEKFSRLMLTHAGKPAGVTGAGALAIGQAVHLIRVTLGLPAVELAPWADAIAFAKAKAEAAAKRAAARADKPVKKATKATEPEDEGEDLPEGAGPSYSLPGMLAQVRDMSQADLKALLAAVQAQIVA